RSLVVAPGCHVGCRARCGLRPPHAFPTRRSSDLVAERALHPVLDRTVTKALDGESADAEHRVLAGDVDELAAGFGPCPQRCERRSEEHTSELQSRFDLVCRLLLEKKNTEPTVLQW